MYLFYIGLCLGSYYFGVGIIMMLYYLYNLYKNNTKENILKALFFTSLTFHGFINTLFYIIICNLYNLLLDYETTLKTLNNITQSHKDSITHYKELLMKSHFVKDKVNKYNKLLMQIKKLARDYKLEFILETDYEYYVYQVNNFIDTKINNLLESNDYLKRLKDNFNENYNENYNVNYNVNYNDHMDENLNNLNAIFETMKQPHDTSTNINLTPTTENMEELSKILTTLNNLQNMSTTSNIGKPNRAQRRLAKKNK